MSEGQSQRSVASRA
jgi:hypothetical protein